MDSRRPGRSLSAFPRVEVVEDAIVIINEDDERIIWGYEDDRAAAENVTAEIEVGLRSISYIRSRLLDFLNHVTDELLDCDVPVEMLEGVIDEAYCDIHRTLPRITKQLRTRAEGR